MRNTQTGETKIQLQTALEDLKSDVGDAPFVPGIHQAVTAAEKALEANTAESMAAIMGKYNGGAYVPKGDQAESALIAQKVLSAKLDDLAWDWAQDLEHDIELFYDEANGLHSDAIEEETSNVVTMFGGIGMAAEEDVTEAELDERVPPQDPVRALIRQLMGEVADIRTDISMLGAKADNLLGTVDELLKASILS